MSNAKTPEELAPKRRPVAPAKANKWQRQYGRASIITFRYRMSDGPRIKERKRSRVHYSDSKDLVSMPLASRFDNPVNYYWSLYYGLARSTGHAKRLNRRARDSEKWPERFLRAKEEFVSHMAAAIICEQAGFYDDWWEKQFQVNLLGWVLNWYCVVSRARDEQMLRQSVDDAYEAASLILGGTLQYGNSSSELSACPEVANAIKNNAMQASSEQKEGV